MDAATWNDTRVSDFLDTSAYLASRNYSTPWEDFSSVPDKYQYAITIFAAIQYWWGKAGVDATKFDMQVGGTTGQRSSSLFSRAFEMIRALQTELESLGLVSEYDIIVGDLVTRSKQTGRLIPYHEDPAGDWLS